MGGWEFLDAFNVLQISRYKSSSTHFNNRPWRSREITEYPMVDFLSKPITVSMLEYLSAKFNNTIITNRYKTKNLL
jgi:arsenate reductase-like glutaredoxin family protein